MRALCCYWIEAKAIKSNDALIDRDGVNIDWVDVRSRYRIYHSEITHLKTGDSCQSDILDDENFLEILCDITGVIILNSTVSDIPAILRVLAESTSSSYVFRSVSQICPSVLEIILSFLLDSLFLKPVAQGSRMIEIQRFTLTSILISVAKVSIENANSVLSKIVTQAAPTASARQLAANLYCAIIRQCLQHDTVGTALARSIFVNNEGSQITAIDAHCSQVTSLLEQLPYSSLLYGLPAIASHWIISGSALSDIEYYIDSILLTVENIIFLQHTQDQWIENVKNQCGVLLAVLLFGTSPAGIPISGVAPVHKVITRISEWNLLPLQQNRSYLDIIRLKVSLIIYALSIFEFWVDLDVRNHVSFGIMALSNEISAYYNICNQLSHDNYINQNNDFFSFYIRAALVLSDGESLSRLALEELGCAVTQSWSYSRTPVVVTAISGNICARILQVLNSMNIDHLIIFEQTDMLSEVRKKTQLLLTFIALCIH